MNVFDFEAKTINGELIPLSKYENKVLLIVNTASKCGFTSQYSALQHLYETFNNQGLIILGFPCNQFMGQEPGENKEIEHFCKVQYGVKFEMFSKVDVKGENIHPLFEHLTTNAPGVLGTKTIKWNFTKFLINSKGEVFKRYAPNINPIEMKGDIEHLLREVPK